MVMPRNIILSAVILLSLGILTVKSVPTPVTDKIDEYRLNPGPKNPSSQTDYERTKEKFEFENIKASANEKPYVGLLLSPELSSRHEKTSPYSGYRTGLYNSRNQAVQSQYGSLKNSMASEAHNPETSNVGSRSSSVPVVKLVLGPK